MTRFTGVFLCLSIISLAALVAKVKSAEKVPILPFDLQSSPGLAVDGFEIFSPEIGSLQRLRKLGYKNHGSQGGWRKDSETEVIADAVGERNGLLTSIGGHVLSYRGRVLLRTGDRRELVERAIAPFVTEIVRGKEGIVGQGHFGSGRYELGVYFDAGVVKRIHLGMPVAFAANASQR